MSLLNALGSMLGANKDYCPDCGMEMKSNGRCPECGYGEDDSMEDDGEEEGMDTQAMLDLRDTIQNALKQLDRLIVGKGGSGGSEKPSAPQQQPQQIVWVRQHSK